MVMPRLTLNDAAEYIRSGKRTSLLTRFLALVKRIFNWEYERSNRLNRFIEIAHAYKRGERVEDIAKRYGCNRSNVLRYARMAELDKRPRGISPETRKEVLVDYKLGLPIADIAKLHGVSIAYVSSIANKAGIGRNPHRKS
jgi:DNA-directed RNA polymerase specialized sigma24 family protein